MGQLSTVDFIRQIDHFVLTTRSLADCLHFYTDVFGMRHEERGVHHALYSGTQKINVHTVKGEFRLSRKKVGIMHIALIS